MDFTSHTCKHRVRMYSLLPTYATIQHLSCSPLLFAFLGIIPWTPAWQLLTSAQWSASTSKRCEDCDKNPGCPMRDSNTHDQETENLQKSGYAIRECRHQVSYMGTTIMQGESTATCKCWEDIFSHMAPATGWRQQQPSLASFSSGTPVSPLQLPFPQTLNSDRPRTISILLSQSGASKGPSGFITAKYDAKQGKIHIYFLQTTKQSAALLTHCCSSCLRDPVQFISHSKVHKKLGCWRQAFFSQPLIISHCNIMSSTVIPAH